MPLKKTGNLSRNLLDIQTGLLHEIHYYPVLYREVYGIYLGLSWHSVLEWDTDLRAFTLSGEAGSGAQGVLHLYGGRGAPSNGGHKLYGGQDPWRCGLKGNEVEQVLTRRCVTKRHLRRTVEG